MEPWMRPEERTRAEWHERLSGPAGPGLAGLADYIRRRTDAAEVTLTVESPAWSGELPAEEIGRLPAGAAFTLDVREKTVLDPGQTAGMAAELAALPDPAGLVYRLIALFPDSGEYGFYRSRNGADEDLWEEMADGVAGRETRGGWDTQPMYVSVDFDFEEWPEVTERLHRAVRRHVPAAALPDCQRAWDEGDEGCLLADGRWPSRDLRDVEAFLRDVQAVLAPLDGGEEWSVSGDCWAAMEDFGAATLDLDGEEVRLIGALY